MQELKIEPNVRAMRCQKCYRLHDLMYTEIDNTIGVGYFCPFHKKANLGYKFLFKYAFISNLRIPTIRIVGHLKEIKPYWFEVAPPTGNKTMTTSLQLKMEV